MTHAYTLYQNTRRHRYYMRSLERTASYSNERSDSLRQRCPELRAVVLSTVLDGTAAEYSGWKNEVLLAKRWHMVKGTKLLQKNASGFIFKPIEQARLNV